MTKSKHTAKTESDYDAVIVGGGMIGASLAIALSGQGLRVVIIEAHKFNLRSQPSYDDRAIALAYGSRCIFEGLGIWSKICDKTTPIKGIHISDQKHFGVTRINHEEEKVDALGYVITARDLGQVLIKNLKSKKDIQIISPATLNTINTSDNGACCTVDSEQGQVQLNARLIIAADGGQSTVRKLLGFTTLDRDYQQTAVIANISSAKPHANVAFERFTANGPLALLPMPDKRCAIVWTQPSTQVDEIMALDDSAFLHRLQSSFGMRLGRLTNVGTRHTYPLSLVQAKQQIDHRLVLIGNAAHTLHPIAGQGFNLGLRDVAALAQVITDAHSTKADIGNMALLQQYIEWRKKDQRIITGFTDNLVKVFSNAIKPLTTARNVGLIATDIFPPLKHLLAGHTMGVSGKLPRLAMGEPL